MSTRVQKLITFSPQLFTNIERKATLLGVSFPEYIRGLAVEDLKEERDYLIASPELEEQIGQAMEEVRAGKGKPLDPFNDADIDALFNEKE